MALYGLLLPLGVMYVVLCICRFIPLTGRHKPSDGLPGHGAEVEAMIGLKVTLAVGAMILVAAGMPRRAGSARRETAILRRFARAGAVP